LDVRETMHRYATFFGADMLFSRGYYPKNHNLKHNFTHCVGLWYARATTAVRAFMRDSPVTLKKGRYDDQFTLNEALLHYDVSYETRQHDVRVGTARLLGDRRLVVGNVDYNFVARECPSDAPIAHCHTAKNAAAKLAALDTLTAGVRRPPDVRAPRVFMLDVPATAGAPLSSALRAALGCTPPGACCRGAGTGDCDATRRGDECGLFGCRRRVALGAHDAYEFVVLSIREPMARACADHGARRRAQEPFAEHMRRVMYRNVLARMLGGHAPSESNTTLCRDQPRVRADSDQGQLLTLAQLEDIVVRRVDAVVCAERFARSLNATLRLLAARFGVRAPPTRDYAYDSGDDDVSDCADNAALRDKFERLNRVDVQLYRFILGRFDYCNGNE
jgi:hypothetical protein